MMGRIMAGAGVLALVALMALMFGNARYAAGELAERDRWRVAQGDAAERVANQRLEDARRTGIALASQAERLASRQPIIVRSTNIVREYAQTAAGAVLCLPAERVHGIDALDRELFPTGTAAPSGARTVPADADATPG